MNILVIGGTGFVGKALVKRLIEEKKKVFLLSRDRNFSCKGAKIFYGDLEDKDFSRKILKKIDLVYYLAAYKKNIKIHTEKTYEVLSGNVLPFLNFLDAVRGSTVKKIVYLSSANAGYALEDSASDGYSIGKYINELIAKQFVNQTKIDLKIVRSVGVYGPGDNFNRESANFIPSTIIKVLESEKEVSVWGTGKRKMQFIFIDDLIENIVKITESKKSFFVLGNKEVSTINGIVSKVIELSGKKLKIKNDSTKADKPSLIIDLINAYSSKVKLKDGLKKTLEYYKNHA